MRKLVIGIDFGSLSARAVLVDPKDGQVLSTAVMEYPHGVMSEALPDGTKLPPLFALQHPKDYTDALSFVVRQAVKEANVEPDEVIGLCVDFTTCTMLPIDEKGVPLCYREEFVSEPHAYAKLWKHHSAYEYANAIVKECQRQNVSLAYVCGNVSSEWLLPKIMETADCAPDVFDKTFRFTEASDWLSLVLTGKETRCRSFLGFKALWTDEGGYLPNSVLKALNPRLDGLATTKLSNNVVDLTCSVGNLSKEGAELVGLTENCCVCAPMIDSHASFAALGIIGPNELLVALGTSTVHALHVSEKVEINGILGYCKDGCVPGLYTYDAGQASCGDQFAWYVDNCLPKSVYDAAEKEGKNVHAYLSEKAAQYAVGESGLLAIDWFNGNRCPYNDAGLSGMLLGLNLQTTPEAIYRALIEGTAYGTRWVVEDFESQGIAVNSILALGGIAEKNAFLMQIYADVLNREILVPKVSNSSAYGSAINATVAAGIYPDLQAACAVLARRDGKVYRPQQENVAAYDKLFAEYVTLAKYFAEGQNDVMKRLIQMQKN